MTTGGGIALIIIGAILAFAVELDVAGISITVIGYILMLGGLAGLVFGLAGSRRRRVATRTVEQRPAARETVVEDRDVL